MANPGFYLYGGDWFKKTRILSLEARGAWIDMLVALNESRPRGTISWNLDQFARFFSDSKDAALRVLCELQSANVANIEPDLESAKNLDVTNCHIKIAVTSRRMKREEKKKENDRLRQHDIRHKQKNRGDVTRENSASSSSSSISNLNTEEELDQNNNNLKSVEHYRSNEGLSAQAPKPDIGPDTRSKIRFEKFWTAYPRKAGRGAAEKAWKRIGVSEALLAVMLTAIEKQKTTRDWLESNGRFIPHPTTWLNQRRWTDELAMTEETKSREEILRDVRERKAQAK